VYDYILICVCFYMFVVCCMTLYCCVWSRLEQSGVELKAAEAQAEEADVHNTKAVAAAIRHARSKLAAARQR
jgi:hypothetical protein